MTETDNEAVEAVARALRRTVEDWQRSNRGDDWPGQTLPDANLARAAIAAMPGWRKGGPVAWHLVGTRTLHGAVTDDALTAKAWVEAGLKVEPLYALPAPPKPEGA